MSYTVTRVINGKRVTEPAAPLNPWRLTLTHAEVMDALCEVDGQREVAERMGIAPNTVLNHTQEIRKRMGVRSTVRAAVKWALWRQGEGKGVPA